MTINPKPESILASIGCGSGLNDYSTINKISKSHLLPSLLPNLAPYPNCISLASDGCEKNIRFQADSDGQPDTSHFQTNPNTNSDKRILIVDDDHDIAKFFKLALDRVGFITEVSNNPLSALTNFKKGAYDLLLLDINMPNMSGFELYKKISKIDSEVKVCFITAYEEYYSEFKNEFPDLDEAKCYIKKPVGMDSLIDAVKTRLESN